MKNRFSVHLSICFAVVVGSLRIFTQDVHAGTIGSTQVIAVSGEAPPDNNGTFFSFLNPVLGDAGQVVFQGFVAATSGGESDNAGIYFQGAGGDLIQIARKGETLNGNGKSIFGFNRPLVNDTGQAAVFVFYNDADGGFTGDAGIVRYDGVGPLTELARLGQPSPSGKGDLSVFGSGVSWNDAGEVAFLGTFTNPANQAMNGGIFVADDAAPFVEIGIQGQPSPDGNGNFTGFGSPALNNSGDTAFFGTLTGASTGGIFVRNAPGTIAPIIRQGQAAPDGNGTFNIFANVGVSESGDATFIATLDGTAGGANDNTGVFIGNGSDELVQVARYGQPAPDGNGIISAISNRAPITNDVGQTAFLVGFAGTSGGANDDIAIARGRPTGGFELLVRKSEPAPDGNGKLLPVSDPALNTSGQIAFVGGVTETNGGLADDTGLFLFDDSMGLMQVARKGDAFLGSTITELAFANGLETVSDFNFTFADEASGLNDAGQVAYLFILADGRQGIALWSCPNESPELAITNVSLSGNSLMILFTGEAGASDWKVKGSRQRHSFLDDKTADSAITETSPGHYTAVVNVASTPSKYFVRIER